MCLAFLFLLTLFAGGRLVFGGTIIGQDSATQFYPWYSYLGERLRSLQIPLWSPSQFGGGPFAGDPQSGWTYLPAMVFFTILPIGSAANAYLLFHLALAGFATYALARVLGIRPLGALVAAVAYEFSGLVYGRSVCCPAQIQVSAWIPVMLLGVDLSLKQLNLSSRARWWGVAGFALSQILASWLGQVGYYALLVLGSYVFYRTIIDPPGDSEKRLRVRFTDLAINGGAILAIGFGLAAVGLLPRFEYNALSNVAGGVYGGEQSYAAVAGGWVADSGGLADLSSSLYYPGGAVLALGLMAIVFARNRIATRYFIFLSAGGLVLAMADETPLQWLLYRLLPRFESLHVHWPERVAIVSYIAPAILAGVTVDALPGLLTHRWRLFAAAAVPSFLIAALAFSWQRGEPVPWQAFLAAFGAVLIVAACLRFRNSSFLRLIPAGLFLLVALDLVIAGPKIMAAAPYGGFHRVELSDYYGEGGAIKFLEEQQRVKPSRYFGYDPSLLSFEESSAVLYRYQFADPGAAALGVNNRATVFGLQDIQGYNPVQLKRYVDFMSALNGTTQEYHDANVFQSGLNSPLLDLLNVRYILVPAVIPAGRQDLTDLVAKYPSVYQDNDVQILERTSALPRAWIVHEARQTDPANALSLLASGAVDPRETGLVESTPPELERPSDTSSDQANVIDYQPESIKLSVFSSASGLVVLSEVSYPGWKVFVDGEPAKTFVVDQLLRGVAIPAGAHLVEWRYESRSTMIGLGITLTTILGLGGLTMAPLWSSRRMGERTTRRALSPSSHPV